MSKEEFFYKPKTANEILGNKSKVMFAESDIAECVLELYDDEGLIIPELVPEEFESRMRFLKKAPQVVLDTGESQFDAIKRKITPLEARRKASSNLKKDEKYCGLVWKSLRKNEHKRVSLVESMEGAKLFAYSKLAGALIDVKPYNAAANAGYFGGKFKVSVPSRGAKSERYEMTLESVPITQSKFNPVIWTDITANHYCGITGNDFSYKYVSSEDFCAHVIAAYIEMARQNRYDKKNIVPLEFMPFPMPSEETVKFYNKLLNNVMVQTFEDGKRRKRALNKAEKEILLWDLVKIEGHDKILYAEKKLQEYKWAA